jgi:hypothetical protein
MAPTPRATVQERHLPQVIQAQLPLYPGAALTAHLSGTVEIRVTVENGSVTDAQVESSTVKNQVLPLRSLENVKTWKFRTEDKATFLVKYIYVIEGDETLLPESPKVELDLPSVVKITARPLKPTCNDCDVDASGKPVRQ